MGIRIRAESLAGLIEPAANGLYAVIGEPASVGERESLTLGFSGDDPAWLLRDYLSELLMLFELRRRVAVGFDATTFFDGNLAVTIQAERVDLNRSGFHHEVKAIT